MKNFILLSLISPFFILFACGQNTIETSQQNQRNIVNEDCNWCGTTEAPENVTWKAIIPTEGESEKKLIISGVVYLPDGKTPAKGVIIYVYHTNSEGIYQKKGDEVGNGQYHGYLRAWMETDSSGRYEFETFRPAPYYSHGGEPAHIHYNVQASGQSEYWLSALWFADDPRITDESINSIERSGGFSNITALTIDSDSVLKGERNIILEKIN